MWSLDWLADAAWRGAALLVLVFLVDRALRYDAAALRHRIWVIGLAGVLAMPLLSQAIPWNLPVLPPSGIHSVASPSQSGVDGPRLASAISEADASMDPVFHDGSTSIPDVNDAAAPAASASLTSRLLALVPFLWLAGLVIILGRLVLGVFSLSRIARRARAVEEPGWVEALEAACRRIGMHARPRLLWGDAIAVPCTAGWLRPIVMLPAGAESWDAERRDVVLLHELAHIHRGDMIAHLLARLTVAVQWFNPLVWLAARRLWAEAERACDELVLATGARPSAYADHLLAIVRAAKARWTPAPTLPMARRSDFEGRLLSILEFGRRRGLSPRAARATVAVVFAALLPVAAAGAGRLAAENPVAHDAKDSSSKQHDRDSENDPARRLLIGEAGADLSRTLRDPVPEVRAAAAEALGSLQDTTAVLALIDVLGKDTDASVRRAAAWALGQIEDPRAIPSLGEALRRDTDVDVRRMAAEALGDIDDRRAIPPLSEALQKDDDAEVRARAAHGLGHYEDAGSLPVLLAVLEREKIAAVKLAVLETLGDIGDKRAFAQLVPILRDADPEIRVAAVHALGHLEDERGLDPLATALRDSDAAVRVEAAEALSRISDRRAAPVLGSALKDASPEVRRAAADAIGNLDELRRAPPELIAALKDADIKVRREVIESLGEIRDPAAVPGLLDVLRTPEIELRLEAIEALGNIGDASAIAALRAALKDSDPNVRRKAAKALGEVSR